MREGLLLPGAAQALFEVSGPLLAAAITTVALFATLKKSYYTMFDMTDVVKRYRLLGRIVIALATYGISVFLSAAIQTLPLDSLWGVLLQAFLLTLSALLILWLLAIIYDSFRIIFSTSRCELRLLDKLYLEASLQDIYLRKKDCGGPAPRGINNEYLMECLLNHTRRLQKKLSRSPSVAGVSFFCTVEQAPLENFWEQRMVLLTFDWALFPITYGCISLVQFFLQWPAEVFFYGSAALLAAALLLVLQVRRRCPPLGQMRRVFRYGPWGYRFSDAQGKPLFYTSTRMFALPWRPGVRWARSLLSFVAFYRIQQLHGYELEAFQHLEVLMKEKPHGAPSFLYAAPCLACACLGYERGDDQKKAEIAKQVRRLGLDWEDPVSKDLAVAVLTDVKRDLREAGASYQALVRGLSAPSKLILL